jgi:hypothetical protein
MGAFVFILFALSGVKVKDSVQPPTPYLSLKKATLVEAMMVVVSCWWVAYTITCTSSGDEGFSISSFLQEKITMLSNKMIAYFIDSD